MSLHPPDPFTLPLGRGQGAREKTSWNPAKKIINIYIHRSGRMAQGKMKRNFNVSVFMLKFVEGEGICKENKSYIYVYIHTYTYICIYTYIYIYMYIYIHEETM